MTIVESIKCVLKELTSSIRIKESTKEMKNNAF